MINIFSSIAPLAANGVVQSPWIDVTGNGDVPYLVINASSDQAGSFQVFESESEQESALLTAGVLAPNAASIAVSTPVNRRWIRITYTNGPTAQNSFALNLWATANPSLGNTRLLELILRELRALSLLMIALKEPTGSTVNIPLGSGTSST